MYSGMTPKAFEWQKKINKSQISTNDGGPFSSYSSFTNGKKLSALCELNHIDIAPHHDCYIHAPLVASTPSGRIVESFDNERDPLQAELFENPHEMNNGWIHLNEKPGLGLEISDTALKKFGKLVYKNK